MYCVSRDVWGDTHLQNLQSMGVLSDVLYILVSRVGSQLSCIMIYI